MVFIVILVSDRFFIYFPILIVLLCTGTYFKLGTRCLSSIGFAQFLQSDELTTDLMEEGKAFVNRGKLNSCQIDLKFYQRSAE